MEFKETIELPASVQQALKEVSTSEHIEQMLMCIEFWNDARLTDKMKFYQDHRRRRRRHDQVHREGK
jgi:hypothetical protein